MEAIYDYETDTLTVIFFEAPVIENEEDKEGVILDYDASGNLVSVEILDASKPVADPRSVTLCLSLAVRKGFIFSMMSIPSPSFVIGY